ncbi:MAG: hypothetical protein ABIT38_04695 [Gemmatimonadaceae bacterium]
MMSRADEGAAELSGLMQNFCALTECAIRACDSGDAAALAGALDGRDLITRRLTPLLREMLARRRATPNDNARAAFDRLLLPVRASAEEARHINSELEMRANVVRADLGAQLGRLSHDDSARSAYSAAVVPHSDSLLDIRR